MRRKLNYYFLTFVFYSFTGEIVEGLYFAIANNFFRAGWVEHQFLRTLPFVPIHGIGALMLVLFFDRFAKLKKNMLLTFIICALICATVELVAGEFFVLTTGSNKLWDYSNMPFNFRGQICLQNTILFGIGGVILINFIQPLFERLVERRNLTKVSVIIAIVMVADVIYSMVKY